MGADPSLQESLSIIPTKISNSQLCVQCDACASIWQKLAYLSSSPIVTEELLPWVDGMLDAGEKFYECEGKSLYSSHMLDLSEEPIDDNLSTCKEYFARMNSIGMTIEIELGVTGGEEDGVDNTDIDSSRLYTQPEEVNQAYETLIEVSPRFTVAAAFGNVHQVYKPGNVELTPKILLNSQNSLKTNTDWGDKPVHFLLSWKLSSSRAN